MPLPALKDTLHTCALAALAALPWLWPFTFGPTASVLPYLASAALGALLLALWPARRERGIRVVAAGWLLAALASAAIALLQYFGLEAPLFPWVNISRTGQAFGNLRQPNQLATLLVMGLVALRWWHGHWQGGAASGGRAHLVAATAAAAAAALLLAGLAASASRAGLLELAALAALAFCWAGGPGRQDPKEQQGQAAQAVRAMCGVWAQGRVRAALLGVAALLAYAACALALPALLQATEGVSGRSMADRLQNAEGTCGSRLILWRNVLHLVAQKPWTGWGWGDLAYAHYITLYDGARFCHILDNAHNLPLHLAVSLGVPAALLACAALAWLLWRARPWAERDADRQLAWGALLCIGLHSLVEYPLWYAPFQIAALMALWLLRPAAGAEDAAPASAAPRRAALCAVAACALAALAYAGWDYHRISQIYLPQAKRSAWYAADAMGHARLSWLFADEVRFAETTMMQPAADNAARLLGMALQTLHYSPEPRVIARVVESATLLGRDDLALAHLARFRAAFAAEYARWEARRQAASAPAAATAPDEPLP